MNYEAGRAARWAGKPWSDNPYLSGTTKLGNPTFSDRDAGSDWERGWHDAVARKASEAEVRAAASVDVRRFRRRSK